MNTATTTKREGHVAEHMALDKPEWARAAERDFKVPIEGDQWPRFVWVACVTAERGEQPTTREIEQVASYIDFMLSGFYGNGGFAQDVRALDLPLAPGHNTAIFVKYENGGWGYRRRSFRTPSWPRSYMSRPAKNLPDHALTLVEVIDYIACPLSTYGDGRTNPKWETWKEERPEVFA